MPVEPICNQNPTDAECNRASHSHHCTLFTHFSQFIFIFNCLRFFHLFFSRSFPIASQLIHLLLCRRMNATRCTMKTKTLELYTLVDWIVQLMRLPSAKRKCLDNVVISSSSANEFRFFCFVALFRFITSGTALLLCIHYIVCFAFLSVACLFDFGSFAVDVDWLRFIILLTSMSLNTKKKIKI